MGTNISGCCSGSRWSKLYLTHLVRQVSVWERYSLNQMCSSWWRKKG